MINFGVVEEIIEIIMEVELEIEKFYPAYFAVGELYFKRSSGGYKIHYHDRRITDCTIAERLEVVKLLPEFWEYAKKAKADLDKNIIEARDSLHNFFIAFKRDTKGKMG